MSTRKNQIHDEWYQQLQNELSLADSKQKEAILEMISIIDDFFDADSLEGHVGGLHDMLCGYIENKVLNLPERRIINHVSSVSNHVDFIVRLSTRWLVVRG